MLLPNIDQPFSCPVYRKNTKLVVRPSRALPIRKVFFDARTPLHAPYTDVCSNLQERILSRHIYDTIKIGMCQVVFILSKESCQLTLLILKFSHHFLHSRELFVVLILYRSEFLFPTLYLFLI